MHKRGQSGARVRFLIREGWRFSDEAKVPVREFRTIHLGIKVMLSVSLKQLEPRSESGTAK